MLVYAYVCMVIQRAVGLLSVSLVREFITKGVNHYQGELSTKAVHHQETSSLKNGINCKES